MDYSRVLEVFMRVAESRHARRLAWGVIAVGLVWAIGGLAPLVQAIGGLLL